MFMNIRKNIANLKKDSRGRGYTQYISDLRVY